MFREWFMLSKENTGLIVIDIQGKLARLVHDSDVLLSNCAKLIQGVQLLNLPIIGLEQNPEKLGATVEELNPLLSCQPIPKFTFDASEEPNFLEAIRMANVGTWLLCGIEAHICVYQTALNLKAKGFSVQLVNDCISSRTLENKHLAINKLVNIGVELTGLEMCLFELVKDCRAPEFKGVLNLIK
jgi:nicotinamidase-related amidase